VVSNGPRLRTIPQFPESAYRHRRLHLGSRTVCVAPRHRLKSVHSASLSLIHAPTSLPQVSFTRFFKIPNAITASTVNHNQPDSSDIAVTIIAAAHIIDCEIIIRDITFSPEEREVFGRASTLVSRLGIHPASSDTRPCYLLHLSVGTENIPA